MSTAEQILAAAKEIQRKTRGGKASWIYASEGTILRITGYLEQKKLEEHREEIERMLNRRK